MSYTKAGPFTDDTAPAINAAFLNALETFLNSRVADVNDFTANKVPVSNGSAWVAQLIANGQIDAAAAIAYSKLNLASSITRSDTASSFAPSARVFHNAAQSINNNTTTILAFNSERFDTDTIHDTVTNNSRLTCKTAGKYIVSATIGFASNATGVREVDVKLNGTTNIARRIENAVNGDNHYTTVDSLYDLAVNDYLEIAVVQTSGGALNVLSSGNSSPEFGMVRVA